MSSLNDPAKKASIDALLNPQPTSYRQIPVTSTVNGLHAEPHAHQQLAYNAQYTRGGSFPLKAASWALDGANSRQGELLTANSHRRHGSDPVSQMSGSYVYGGRTNVQPISHVPAQNEIQHQTWPSYPEARRSSSYTHYASPPYPDGRSVFIDPMHSKSQSDMVQSTPGPELTNCGSHKNCKDTDNYPPSDFSVSEYQPAERISLRQAARALAPPVGQPSNPHQPNGYYRSASHQQGPYDGSTPNPPYHHHQMSHPLPVTTQAQPAQATSKRQLSEEDANESTPKPKRGAKAKPKVGADRAEGSPAPSKRGFNAKKRTEAAQAAAQAVSEHIVPSVAFSVDETQQGKRLPPSLANGSRVVKLKAELQYARCMSTKYKNDKFSRCVSCTRRWAGDTCRFQGIRFLLRTEDNALVGFNFVDRAEVPALQFPEHWNIPLRKEHLDRVKRVIANALLPTLKHERNHLGLPELVKRTRESEVRVTCDTCMTSIFSSSWFCRLCGREACHDCFTQIQELTHVPPSSTHEQVVAMRAQREKFALSNPFFLACNKRNEHEAWQFSPMTRFVEEELEEAIIEMERLLVNASPPATIPSAVTDGQAAAIIPSQPLPTVPPAPTASEANGDRSWKELYLANQTKASYLPPHLAPSGAAPAQHLPPNLGHATAIVPTKEPYRYTNAEVTGVDSAAKFARIWEHGEPLVISNILENFKLRWTPEYFVQEFGDRECLITECERDENKRTTIRDFFSTFGNYTGRTEVWKLKDWPPSADFKTAFPQLYEDFSNAIPVPDYVRRDGVYNVASHFPANVVGPDLGPKMYNAYAAKQGPGSKGSTRLHMDMADALNVMLYTADCPDGSEGCAVWDIYQACDSDKIRTFLRRVTNLPNYDPIHGQQYYLDDSMRMRLYEEFDVKSYRIYQRPGEAIFIPAGCAHQVLNMSDSIKIAIDYVSPENINRCAQLTREFREQNKSKVWKEDVLQLKTMMWFAWQSCRKRERLLLGPQPGPSTSNS